MKDQTEMQEKTNGEMVVRDNGFVPIKMTDMNLNTAMARIAEVNTGFNEAFLQMVQHFSTAFAGKCDAEGEFRDKSSISMNLQNGVIMFQKDIEGKVRKAGL